MIKNFRHKGLKELFETGKSKDLNPNHVSRLRNILALLETAESLRDMDLPGLRLHQLKGSRRGTWAVNVSANWRVTFKFQGNEVLDVNYEDYH